MNTVNRVVLIGNLGCDPSLRANGAGTPVSNFDIATSETWDNKEGERQERTEWHKIVVWGRLAELAHKKLAKGKKVYLEGKLQTRNWVDNEGFDRNTTEIVVQNMIFFDSRGRQEHIATDIKVEEDMAEEQTVGASE